MSVMLRWMGLILVFLLTCAVQAQSEEEQPESLQVITPLNIVDLTEISRYNVNNPYFEYTRFRQIMWTPDSQALVVVTDEYVLRYPVHEADWTPDVLLQVEGQHRIITCAALSADGRWMAVASGELAWPKPIVTLDHVMVEIYDLSTGRVVSQISPSAATGLMSFTPDGQTLITVDSGYHDVEVWGVASEQRIATYLTHQPGWGFMLSITLSDDGSLLALGLGSSINSVSIWDTHTGKQVAERGDGMAGLLFSPDNQRLVQASRYGGYGRFWSWSRSANVHTRAQPFEYSGHDIYANDFTPDGRLYAQISLNIQSGNVILLVLDATTQEKRYQLLLSKYGNWDYRTAMSFSRDGTMLMTYNGRGEVRLWAVPQPS